MTAPIPRSITVGPYRLSIVLDREQMATQGSSAKGWELAGSLSLKKQRIIVDPEQGPDSQADTVLHELLHAVFKVSAAGEDDDDEERLVSHLTPLLLDTLRRNPDLVAYLTADLHAEPEPF